MRIYRRLQEVQAITFDLDDTLYDNRPVIERLEIELNNWMAVHHPIFTSRPLSWWKAFKKEIAHREPALTHNVSLWRHQQLQQGLQRLGYSTQQAIQAADDAMEQVTFWRSNFVVPESSHKLLTELCQAFPLIAITNGNVDVDRVGLSHYFEAVYKAGFDCLAKPYPDMFVKAHQELGIAQGNTLHVGDALYSDIVGAKRAGFMACWLNVRQANLMSCRKATLLPDIEIDQIGELHLLL